MINCVLVVCRYNSVFRFLLAVKRVHLALHKSWKMAMSRSTLEPSDEISSMHQLRNHMQFLVDNLQTYLQVQHNTSLSHSCILYPFEVCILVIEFRGTECSGLLKTCLSSDQLFAMIFPKLEGGCHRISFPRDAG